jgi:hypothetical protein
MFLSDVAAFRGTEWWSNTIVRPGGVLVLRVLRLGPKLPQLRAAPQMGKKQHVLD